MTTTTLTWEQVPHMFSLCFSADCPRRAECLHAAAGALMPAPPESAEQVMTVNPYHQQAAASGEACVAFLPAEAQRPALGFGRAWDDLTRRQTYAVREYMFRRMGEGTFYDWKNGRVPLNYPRQQLVRAAFAAAGVEEEISFDEYGEPAFDFDLRLSR